MPAIQSKFNRWDVIGGAPRLVDDGSGNAVISGPILPGTVTALEVVTNGRLALRNGSLVLGDGSTQGGNFLPYLGNTDAMVIVERGGDDEESADNLRTAYTAACALTPGGNALSATNRACVLVPPGRYDFGTGDGSNHGLELDTQYVDLWLMPGAWLTSAITQDNRGTVELSAADVNIYGGVIENTDTEDVFALCFYGSITHTGNLIGIETVTGTANGQSADLLFGGEIRNCKIDGSVFELAAGARVVNTDFEYAPASDAGNVTVFMSNVRVGSAIPAAITNSNTAENISWSIPVVAAGTALTTGDGKAYAIVPAKLNNTRLRRVHARVITAGTTGTTDIQVHNVTDSVDILSTKLTIDSTETGSDTAATPAVINSSNSLLSTNDLLRIDIDAISSTAPQGLIVTFEAY